MLVRGIELSQSVSMTATKDVDFFAFSSSILITFFSKLAFTVPIGRRDFHQSPEGFPLAMYPIGPWCSMP
jgi:hypothetical protein